MGQKLNSRYGEAAIRMCYEAQSLEIGFELSHAIKLSDDDRANKHYRYFTRLVTGATTTTRLSPLANLPQVTRVAKALTLEPMGSCQLEDKPKMQLVFKKP